MSTRKNVLLPHKLLEELNISGVQSVTSAETDVTYLDNVGIQFIWTGTLDGTLKVEVSLDGITWTELTLSGMVHPSGSPDSHFSDINQLPAKKVRVVYDNAVGTGDLTVYIMAKMV